MENSENKIIEKLEISEKQIQLNNKMKKIFLNSFALDKKIIKKQ